MPQLDLLSRERKAFAAGAFHAPDWIDVRHQQLLLNVLRPLTKGRWTRSLLPTATIQPIPDALVLMAHAALRESGVEELYAPTQAAVSFLSPEALLPPIEQTPSATPVILLVLGDAVKFRLGNLYSPAAPYTDRFLHSGDLLVLKGRALDSFQGIAEVLPGTYPPELRLKQAGSTIIKLSNHEISS